jgi:hypothetical protein
MISVIVPVVNEPPEALAELARLVSAPGAELLFADGARGPRGACLAQAAARARGDILFFVHADSRPPPDAVAIIERAVAGGAVAGAFRLRYDSDERRMRWIAWWANARARHLGLPFGDQGLFCRREAYLKAGGFRDLPVCDDLDLVRRLRKTGPFCLRPEPMTTSARRYAERGALRQVFRVWRVAAGYFLGVSAERLGRWYYR